eukprot:scaffold10955_cov48-Phaeocystis_antarctica.AAC.1
MSCGYCLLPSPSTPPSPPPPSPSPPSAEEAAAISVTADVTSSTAGHADFTFELIGGGVASVALLALLVFAS